MSFLNETGLGRSNLSQEFALVWDFLELVFFGRS